MTGDDYGVSAGYSDFDRAGSDRADYARDTGCIDHADFLVDKDCSVCRGCRTRDVGCGHGET